jgi:diaminopimelate decarboxylase
MNLAAHVQAPHSALDRLVNSNTWVRDGELHFGGIPLARLAARVGRTPFYAYDRQAISRRVQALRAAVPASIKLHYSIKANPMPALVCHVAGMIDGLDVASAGELRVALDAGMSVERISFSGPGKSVAELSQAVAAGITVNVESARELRLLAEICQRESSRCKVALRVNPDFEVKSAGMKMGGGARPFGIDASQVPGLLETLKSSPLEFCGLQIFAASQALNGQLLAQSLQQTYALAGRLAMHFPRPLRSLNLGGGFGIPYFPGEAELDLGPITRELAHITTDATSRFAGAEMILELGRYLVGEAGIYVTRVVDVKVSHGRTFLITDGGMNHHLAASGNLGQVIRRNYPVLLAERLGAAPLATPVSVCGPLCTPLDTLADKVYLPQAEPGDLVVILQSGAYGASASPGGFLSHPAVAEVLV